jgi:hypothetical protein
MHLWPLPVEFHLAVWMIDAALERAACSATDLRAAALAIVRFLCTRQLPVALRPRLFRLLRRCLQRLLQLRPPPPPLAIEQLHAVGLFQEVTARP